MLEASRRNDDVAARPGLAALQSDFEHADDSLQSLIEFNQRSADDAVTRVVALQKSGATSMQLLALAGMGLSVTLGLAMVGVLQQRAARLRHYAWMLAPHVDGSHVNLLVDVQTATVRCSEGLLRQVMWNLADNAMKYRRAEVCSRIAIRGRVAGGGYELSVEDNGAGISADDTGKVFAPFYRGAGETGPPGTGLGLSIVKRAVEANGGTVSVTSELGRGSTFVARLPLGG